MAEAVRQYVAEQSWQVEAIQEGIRQADEGKFASDHQVTEAFAHWGVHVQYRTAAAPQCGDPRQPRPAGRQDRRTPEPAGDAGRRYAGASCGPGRTRAAALFCTCD